MITNPWKLDEDAWEYIRTFPVEQQADAAITYETFNHNSYKVPCYTTFVMYGLFTCLIAAAGINSMLSSSCPSLHLKLKRKMRIVRAHVWEHPLVQRKHASVVAFPWMQWLSLQLPLRGEAVVIFFLCLINFLPLVAFYDLLIGDRNVFYPGPTSKRDQICRHLADRTGVLGTAQLPLLILMASKRTPLAIVSGLGMDRLMLYHRWISRWFWIHIFIHTLAYTAIYMQVEGGVAAMLKDTYIRWGVVGLSMSFGLVFLSLRALRRRFYEVFVMLHITMAFFAILGTYLHIALIEAPQFEIYKLMAEIAAAVWAFDRVARFTIRFYLSFSLSKDADSSKGNKHSSGMIKCAAGQIYAYGANAEYTRLRISVPVSKLRLVGQPQAFMRGIAAGDDIRITVPRLQWVGEHPFTVFAVGRQQDDAAQGFIDLLIKTEAGLTRKLADRVIDSASPQRNEKDIELAGTASKKSSVSVLIEGPFGVAPELHEATSDLVLVAGGIAITFCWPLFVEAVKSSCSAAVHLELSSCKLIWIVRHESTLTLVEQAFSELVSEMQNDQAVKRCRFSMDIYVTSASKELAVSPAYSRSASTRSIKEKAEIEDAQADQASTPSGTSDRIELPTLARVEQENDDDQKLSNHIFSEGSNGDTIQVSRFTGRPQVLSAALFEHLDQQALLQEREKNLSVALCGPASLCDDVRFETVRLLKKGIHVNLVEDCFTW